jgi:hypothetical protein
LVVNHRANRFDARQSANGIEVARVHGKGNSIVRLADARQFAAAAGANLRRDFILPVAQIADVLLLLRPGKPCAALLGVFTVGHGERRIFQFDPHLDLFADADATGRQNLSLRRLSDAEG